MATYDSATLGLNEDLDVEQADAEQVAGGAWSGYWTWDAGKRQWYWTWLWYDDSGGGWVPS